MHPTTTIRLAFCLTCALTASACAVSIEPQASTTLHRFERRQSTVCEFPFQFDRSGVTPVVPPSPLPDLEGRVFAGYSTNFSPGAPPFACDRLHLSVGQGVFRFGVYRLPDEVKRGFRSARIEVQEFTPLEIGVRWGEPWDTGGNAWLVPSDPELRDTCWFQIYTATENWAPGTLGWGRPAIARRELAAGAQRFEMPTETLRNIYVTDEVLGWLTGRENEFGFTIEPSDAGMNSKTDNICTGLFRFRLIVQYDE